MSVKHVVKVTGVLVTLLAVSAQASASMLASFNWVDLSHSAGVTPVGSLTLTLPDSITTQTFDTGTLTQTQALSMLTGFAYTFSNGLSVNLADLTTFTFSPPIHWATSNANHGGFGTGVDLITGCQFSGSKSFPGDPRAPIYNITMSAGLPSNVTQANNQLTPFAGQGTASNDFGYWKLTSLAPVPLPAALPLLLSGLALTGALRAKVGRRRS